MTSASLTKAVDLWAEIFSKDEIEVVVLAVKSLIQTLEFPPSIADVRKEIDKLVDTVDDKPTAIDEWNAIRSAIKIGIYYADEGFERLPPIAKKFVGSPAQIRDWAMSEDFNDSVVRGQFLKQYETLKNREERRALLTPELKNLIQNLANKKDVKLLED
jgi:hypothetical protein